jgi:hypothetical protein
MSRIALIKNNLVENVIEADMEFAQTLDFDAAVESSNACIGWQYISGEFIAPVPDPDPQPDPSNPDGDGPFLSNYAFDMRYTLPERIAIKRLADQRNQDGSYTDTALAVQVNVERAQKAKFVNPLRTETRNGVMQFVALGVLTEARALEILDAPIQPFEAYTP